jgi:hypothetical protein
MSGKYRKLTLTLVVRSTATDQVRSELEEAAGLIAVDIQTPCWRSGPILQGNESSLP